MFDTLFSRPCAIQRHRSGFLATERTAYLAQLAAQGTPPTTMRIRAHYCLHVARELKNWPRSYWIPGLWHVRMVYTDAIACREPSQESNRAGQHQEARR